MVRNNFNLECYYWIEIRYNMIGQSGIRYFNIYLYNFIKCVLRFLILLYIFVEKNILILLILFLDNVILLIIKCILLLMMEREI